MLCSLFFLANVQKLLSRCKSARDVQSEERQQRLKSVTTKPTPSPLPTDSYNTTNPPAVSGTTSTPKLRDYLKAKNAAKEKNAALAHTQTAYNPNAAQYIPPVRPNPLGSENPTQSVCSGGTYYPNNVANTGAAPPTVGPNEPPPPYSLQQQQYYDPNAAGYTNPMYYQYQQNVAPPAYKPQASPNSQFTALNANMAGLSLQQQQQGAPNHMGAPPTNPAGGYNQLPYNTAGGNVTQSPNVYNNTNQNYPPVSSVSNISQNNYISMPQNPHQNMANYNTINFTGQTSQQQYMTQNSLNNVPQSVYQSSAAAATGANTIPAFTQAHSAQSPLPNSTQIYSQPVVTTASSNTFGTPTPYLYGSNANYQQNFNNPTPVTNNVPPSQPLYVATNQTVPPTLQAPYIVNSQQQTVAVQALQTQQQTTTPLSGQPAAAINPNNLTSQPLPGQSFNSNLPTQNLPPPTANLSNQNVTPTANSHLPGITATSVVPPPSAAPSLGTNVITTQANSTGGGVLRKNSASTMHPGYSYNPQSGTFDYGSGYHQTAVNNQIFYGQYTTGAQPINSQVGTTDSKGSGKANLSTGFDVSDNKTQNPIYIGPVFVTS